MKAYSPMVVMVLGITMLVRPVLAENALVLMAATA
jgi:hypothetical protein